MKKRCIIAIDGPSGAGKSTVSKELARRLGYIYIDTGAMYRAAALFAKRKGIEIHDDQALARMLEELDIRFIREQGELKTLLCGEDVSEAIRTREMSMAASTISARPLVRAKMLQLQRAMGQAGGVVMEGRDIGTVVFPDADFKFFLAATEKVRAQRRHAELAARGERADFNTILEEMRKRDRDDSGRELAPLRPAKDAIIINTSELTIEQVVALLLRHVSTENSTEIKDKA